MDSKPTYSYILTHCDRGKNMAMGAGVNFSPLPQSCHAFTTKNSYLSVIP
ncbi:MAG: hypothetical protein AB4038_10335 [Prochloraceae cyanobacterium]